MLESRFHGLGGQGVVLSAHLIGGAALKAGLWAHSFPFFTTAMRGGTVTAYARIAKYAIDERCFIYTPDVLILFHENLLYVDDVIKGIKPEGSILVNTDKKMLNRPVGFEGNLFVVHAQKIADTTLGRPILSTVMAGAFLNVQEMLTIDLLSHAINEQFSTKLASMNIEAAEQGYVNTSKIIRSTS
jgi:pyruvate ferredoxin oxidoreductase gamma subunit